MKCEIALLHSIHGGQEETEEASLSRLVDGRFTKQEHLHARLDLVTAR